MSLVSPFLEHGVVLLRKIAPILAFNLQYCSRIKRAKAVRRVRFSMTCRNTAVYERRQRLRAANLPANSKNGYRISSFSVVVRVQILVRRLDVFVIHLEFLDAVPMLTVHRDSLAVFYNQLTNIFVLS